MQSEQNTANFGLNCIFLCNSNGTLKEDLFVFEGQQLENFFDLLEEQLPSTVKHKTSLSVTMGTQNLKVYIATYYFKLYMCIMHTCIKYTYSIGS